MMMPDIAPSARFAANHLWQSTLIFCIAAGLAWLLRKSEARFRHAIWMLASLKFLLPFALLEQIGQRLIGRPQIEAPSSPVFTTVLNIGQPFTGSSASLHEHAAAAPHFPWLLCIVLLWAMGSAAVVVTWLLRMRRVGAMVRAAQPQHTGRVADTLRHPESIAGIGRAVPLLLSKDCMEPGIFGILRPVLLWPEGISAHLDDAQVSAIIAHELWHVRRRDNLLALLHMCVEAAFWFHPLVWWMGARLIEERERSCDEAVLQTGNEPAQYADAILKACRFCVESPLTCVSGVSGSDLKRRMVQIMNPTTVPVSRSRKMLLASVAVATLAGPILMGALHPPVVRADEAQKFSTLKFDTASLTPTQSNDRFFVMMHQDEFITNNITLKTLIATAYGVRPDRIVGGPDWLNTQRFDFEGRWTPTADAPAKHLSNDKTRAEFRASIDSTRMGAPGQELEVSALPAPATLQAMLRNFLAERVGLRIRNDSEVQPVYELVVANGGSKLTPAQDPGPLDAIHPDSSGATRMEMKTRMEASAQNGQHSYAMFNGEPRLLCDLLARQLGHEVVDKTGLTGRYDFTLSFSSPANPDQVAASLRDQYGLDLQSTQQPVKVFAIDNVEMPQN